MIPLKIQKNPEFKGRDAERTRLLEIAASGKARIIVVHGRRRVGKTELIEQTFAKRNLLKFEGLERQGKSKQLKQFASTLSIYLDDPLIAKIQFSSWIEAFEYLAKHLEHGRWTLYLEELQWLANYQNELISALKHVWDNKLRHNRELLIILCGSAPSFMINKVLLSSALYNRTEENFPVRPLNVSALMEFFGRKRHAFEVMDAMLTVGAIPPYLERLRDAPSILIGLARNSFQRDGYFVNEYERIFTSSMGNKPNYRTTLEFLAARAYANKVQIAKALGQKSGGGLTDLLEDLEQTGFIQRFTPLNSGPDSRLKRYQLTDPYVRFFINFIKPRLDQIKKGIFDRRPEQAIDQASWYSWMGYNFERWVGQNATAIARILGFDGIDYRVGSYFSRGVDVGSQIDLVFEREDRVTVLTEVKYTHKPIDVGVIPVFEKRASRYPIKSTNSIRKLLISAAGATPGLVRKAYFDKILTLEDLIDSKIWDN